MAFGSLLGQMKKKLGQPGVGTPSLPQTGQSQESGAAGPIMDSIGQFNLGSQTPGQNSENEELRTNRRFNRGVVDGLRNQRTAGRFGGAGGPFQRQR